MVKTSADGSGEQTSPETTVVGLFKARGDAENARNRLKTEEVPEDRMMLKVLPRALSLRPILARWAGIRLPTTLRAPIAAPKSAFT
jgi:hypothetical protein